MWLYSPQVQSHTNPLISKLLALWAPLPVPASLPKCSLSLCLPSSSPFRFHLSTKLSAKLAWSFPWGSVPPPQPCSRLIFMPLPDSNYSHRIPTALVDCRLLGRKACVWLCVNTYLHLRVCMCACDCAYVYVKAFVCSCVHVYVSM